MTGARRWEIRAIDFDRDFAQILAAATQGDEAAWREVYLELAPSVRGYLRFRGVPDFDDLTGEVFLQVVRDIEGFEGSSRQFRAWVLSIARNRMLDDARRRRRRPVEAADEATLVAVGPRGDVETEALAKLGTAELLRLIGRLSPDQQDVLVLRLVADLTVGEVAVAIGKRPGAVKALQRRGLRAIARTLGETAR